LFGATEDGGAKGFGTVYEVAAGTHTLATLATFNNTNGANPESSLIEDSAGNLYGTTRFGGANNDGTVFEVAAGTHTLTTLATFNGTDGANPYCSLLEDAAGNLYGTTVNGRASSDGTVFEVAAGTDALTTLISFNGADAANSYAGLIADSEGDLFGTTYSGGFANAGTAFEVTGSGFVVPEPTSISLLMLGGPFLLARRRKRRG
jgi:uncharacterized repeat protein (TIGR03803 family)